MRTEFEKVRLLTVYYLKLTEYCLYKLYVSKENEKEFQSQMKAIEGFLKILKEIVGDDFENATKYIQEINKIVKKQS